MTDKQDISITATLQGQQPPYDIYSLILWVDNEMVAVVELNPGIEILNQEAYDKLPWSELSKYYSSVSESFISNDFIICGENND